MSDISLQPHSPDGRSLLPDADLLRDYAEHANQRAFAELVGRHSGWVISTARRRCGVEELAQEAAQNVFLALARKAARLAENGSMAPWLHRATVLETAALLRRESRYRTAMKRHQQEFALTESSSAADHTWQAVRETVDEALNKLSAPDREVLIRHHVEGRTFQEIAELQGATEAAAQRRGHRALEKLAARLRRRGVTAPAALLGAALSAGMTAESASAGPLAAGLVCAATQKGTAAASAGSHGTPLLPAWAATPAMLAAVGLLSAGVPFLLPPHHPTAAAKLPASGAPPLSTVHSPAPAASLSPPAAAPAARLTFLRQALEALGKSPVGNGPTKLGLQLRKYMLTLPAEELITVGQLLNEVPDYEGEFPAVIEAYSTRLARLDSRLSLELLAAVKGKDTGQAQGLRFSRTALLDVLTRGADLPEVVRICDSDKDLRVKLIHVWAGHHPLDAMVYAEEKLAASPDEFDRSTYLWPWMEKDPAAAAQWLDENAERAPAIYNRANSLHTGLAYWTVRQMPAGEAVDLTLGLKDPLVRNQFISAAFGAFSSEQPEVIARLAPLMQLEDGAKPLSVSGFLNTWRKKDEAAAASWVQGLADSPLKLTALRTLANPLPPLP